MDWLEFLKEEENEILEEIIESPDAFLIKGIVDKDAVKVKKALSLGANTRQLLGKEKLSVFAFRHFDKDVVNVLQKNGMSFKDFTRLITVVVDQDLVDALDWLLDQKAFAGVFQQSIPFLREGVDAPSDPNLRHKAQIEITSLGSDFLENGAVKCLSRFKPIVDLGNRVNGYRIQRGLSRVLKTNDTEAINLFCGIVFNHFNFSKKDFCFSGEEISSFNLQTIAQLDRLISEGILPVSSVAFKTDRHIMPRTIEYVKKLSVDYTPAGKGNYYAQINGPVIESLLQAVVCSGSDVCLNMSNSEKGRGFLFDVLQDKKNMVAFTLNANADVFFGVLKKCPDILALRFNDNSPFHFFAGLEKNVTASVIGKMAALDSKALFEPNDQGFVVSSLAPTAALAAASKKMLKSTVKEPARQKEKKSPARRM